MPRCSGMEAASLSSGRRQCRRATSSVASLSDQRSRRLGSARLSRPFPCAECEALLGTHASHVRPESDPVVGRSGMGPSSHEEGHTLQGLCFRAASRFPGLCRGGSMVASVTHLLGNDGEAKNA